MNQQTVEYIESRSIESENASIQAVSCADIRALLAERQELLDALTGLMAEAVKAAESQDDNAPIWAWIDDASDAISKAKKDYSHE